MTIRVDPDGAGFAIRLFSDAGQQVGELKVSGGDILQLAQSVQQLRAKTLERFQPGGLGHAAVFSTPVERMILAETSLGDGLLLTLIAANGAEATYTLDPDHAQKLADRLVAKVDDLGKPEVPRQ